MSHRRSQLSQEFCYVRRGPVDGSDELAPHHTVAINNVSFGKFERAIERVALLAGIAHRYKTDVVIFEELIVSTLINIHADRQHRDPFGFHAPLHLNERGHFFHAWRAPRGPEVQHDDLAVIVAELYGALGILDREIRGLGTDAGRAGSAVAGAEHDQQRQNQGVAEGISKASHPDIIMDSRAVEERCSGAALTFPLCWIADIRTSAADYACDGCIWEES